MLLLRSARRLLLRLNLWRVLRVLLLICSFGWGLLRVTLLGVLLVLVEGWIRALVVGMRLHGRCRTVVVAFNAAHWC
jgi:hypothetical protein